jgi:hypothetical protein
VGIRFGRPYGARLACWGCVPRVPSAGADSTLGYFRSLPPGETATRRFGAPGGIATRQLGTPGETAARQFGAADHLRQRPALSNASQSRSFI